MSPGAEVTRLGATDLGAKVPGRALQGILGGVDVSELGAADLGTDLLGAEDTAARRIAHCGVWLLHAPPPSGHVAGFTA